MLLGLNNVIDTELFNKLIVKGGGSPLITKKKLISMKSFISILLKLFRKDYNSSYKKGGFYSITPYEGALKYVDLNYFGSYQQAGINQLERDFI